MLSKLTRVAGCSGIGFATTGCSPMRATVPPGAAGISGEALPAFSEMTNPATTRAHAPRPATPAHIGFVSKAVQARKIQEGISDNKPEPACSPAWMRAMTALEKSLKTWDA